MDGSWSHRPAHPSHVKRRIPVIFNEPCGLYLLTPTTANSILPEDSPTLFAVAVVVRKERQRLSVSIALVSVRRAMMYNCLCSVPSRALHDALEMTRCRSASRGTTYRSSASQRVSEEGADVLAPSRSYLFALNSPCIPAAWCLADQENIHATSKSANAAAVRQTGESLSDPPTCKAN